MALRKICLFLFAIAIPLLAVAGQTQRADAESTQKKTRDAASALAVSPAIMEEVISPGASTSFTLNIHNVTSFPLPVKSFVRNLTVQSAEFEKTDQDRLDASRWFTIDEPDFILQPDQVRTIHGVIAPPANAAPGGHYATIYFQPLVPAEALSPSMAYVNSRVGVLAFLVVKGEIKQKAAFSKQLQAPGLIRPGTTDFTFSVRNSGNVHLMPVGTLTVYDWHGKQVAKLDVPKAIILPDSTKHYSMKWKPPGFIGKYRAELAVTYGADNTALAKSTVTTWVVPWAEILFGATSLGVVLFVARRTKRKWRKAWRVYRG